MQYGRRNVLVRIRHVALVRERVVRRVVVPAWPDEHPTPRTSSAYGPRSAKRPSPYADKGTSGDGAQDDAQVAQRPRPATRGWTRRTRPRRSRRGQRDQRRRPAARICTPVRSLNQNPALEARRGEQQQTVSAGCPPEHPAEAGGRSRAGWGRATRARRCGPPGRAPSGPTARRAAPPPRSERAADQQRGGDGTTASSPSQASPAAGRGRPPRVRVQRQREDTPEPRHARADAARRRAGRPRGTSSAERSKQGVHAHLTA